MWFGGSEFCSPTTLSSNFNWVGLIINGQPYTQNYYQYKSIIRRNLKKKKKNWITCEVQKLMIKSDPIDIACKANPFFNIAISFWGPM